jgi:hypothetical protein
MKLELAVSIAEEFPGLRLSISEFFRIRRRNARVIPDFEDTMTFRTDGKATAKVATVAAVR